MTYVRQWGDVPPKTYEDASDEAYQAWAKAQHAEEPEQLRIPFSGWYWSISFSIFLWSMIVLVIAAIAAVWPW